MNKKKRTIFAVAGGSLVLILTVGAVFWYNSIRQFVSTDDANVDGDEFVISAPASGKILDWDVGVGKTYQAGSTAGEVQVKSGESTSNVPIPVPADGTVVERTIQNNEFVAAGTPLAYTYNLNHLFVTANVKETQIRFVNVGAKVDVTVDAYPGVTLHGSVTRIGLATGSTFSLLPSSSQNANFTKVTQVVPVKIELNGYAGLALDPGMDAIVRIHK
jgi:multidrug resistance efflux pump